MNMIEKAAEIVQGRLGAIGRSVSKDFAVELARAVLDTLRDPQEDVVWLQDFAAVLADNRDHLFQPWFVFGRDIDEDISRLGSIFSFQESAPILRTGTEDDGP